MNNFINGLDAFEQANKIMQHIQKHVPKSLFNFFEYTNITDYCKKNKVVWYILHAHYSWEGVKKHFDVVDCVVISVIPKHNPTQIGVAYYEVTYWKDRSYIYGVF